MEPSSIEELRTATGGRYDIEGFLAEGGMGSVYSARNRALGSRVAIKVLPPEVASSTVRLARFKREAALAANLSHPHIVPVFEFDASHGFAYLIMPFVDGATLADKLSRQERLDYATVREMIRQVGGALSFAHRREVVHRDIKPANILREEATGRWLVTDFGVAHVTQPEATEITKTGVVIGTPAYMAPEQRWGGTVDARSDLYSLAAVAYQALCATPVDQLADELARNTSDIELSLRQAAPDLSPAQAHALAWPLAVVRDERPASVEDWLKALDVAERPRRLARLKWLAALAAGLIAGWLLFRPGQESVAPPTPTVAVFPFQIDVRDDTHDLATLLPQAFDWQLQYLPDHRVLGAEVRNEITARYGSEPPPPDTLLSVARNHGATITVQGRAEARDERVTISILVRDAISGELIVRAESSGAADSLDALVSRIVVEAFAERIAREASGWSSSLPHGLDAINAYVQADRNFRRGSYESAVERLDEVIRLDSTFAPAYFKRMVSLLLGLRPTQYSTQLWSAFEAASKYREGLDPVSMQLLEGYELLLRDGDVSGAEQVFQDIAERYPRALEAWFALGYVQMNLRALLGTSIGEAKLAFQEAVALDSSFATGLWHLALIAVMEDDDAAAQDYLARFFSIDSTSLQAELARTYDSLLYRGISATGHVLGSLDERPTGVLELMSLGAAELRPPPGVRPIAREAVKALWENAGTSGERTTALRMRLAYLLARGLYSSVDTLLREAERMRVPRDEVDRWIVLSAITALPELGDEAAQSAAVGRLQSAEDGIAEALWLTARWHLAHNNPEATRIARQLGQLAADPARSTPLARSLALDLEAERDLLAGDTVGALSTWEEATRHHSIDELVFGLTASLWPLRLDRATAALSAGQPYTSLGVAATFDQMAAFVDQVAWPEILRVRAAAAIAVNDTGLARSTYEELADLLEAANGAGVALRDSVLAALAQLGGGT